MAEEPEDTSQDIQPTAAPAAAPAGPDFTSLVKPPADMSGLQTKLADIQRAKSAATGAIADETTRRLEGDRSRMEAAYKASAVMPEELTRSWDSDAESQKYSTDPVTAFGSIGSVFAMVASSFAGLPMEHALNAGAAAINAVHAGDARAYERAYDSWQKNTNLAIKRHEIQRQAYNDATNLMNSNINAGRTKMELAATKFGDQKVQALLDAGMDKELFDLFSSRNKMAIDLQKQWDEVQLQHEKITDLRSDPRYQSQNLTEKQQAVQDWQRRWSPQGAMKLKYDFKQDYIDNQKKANPNFTPEDLLKWSQEADAAEGDGITTTGKLKTAAIKEIFEKAKADGKPITMAEATRQYQLTTSTPSGNRLDDLAKQINMFDNGKNAIDKAISFIDKHWGTVGVAGYATRGAERVGNIFGSDETDRSQFAHEIQYLQTIAPRLLNDASSRGLKAEADKINKIVAGLELGDTTANTKRALTELRELLDKMQQDNLARRNGTPNLPGQVGGPNPEGGAPRPGSAGGSKKAPWLNDPVVKPSVAGPRADLEEDQAAYG